MPDYTMQAGSTDVSVIVFIFDPATGLPDTTVVFNTSGLDLQYRREGAANVAITEVTLAALTTAHTDGGFLHIGNGYYRLDLPDAAVTSGVSGVLVRGVLTSRVVVGCYIHLVAYNPQDVVRLGLTSLPNVASGSAGAIPTTGTGANQIAVSSGTVSLSSATHAQIDDILVDTGALETRLTSTRAGNLDNLDAAVTTRSSHTAADASDAVWDEARAGHTTAGTFGQNVNILAATQTQIDDILVDTAALDSRLTAGRATNLDNLDAAVSDVPGAVHDEDRTGHDTAGTFGAVLSALPEATAGSVGGLALYDNVFSIAVLGFVDDASATDDGFDGSSGLEDTSNIKYVGAFLVFPQGSALHPEARKISAYTASTRSFEFNGTGDDADRPFSAAPTNGDPFFIVGIHGT